MSDVTGGKEAYTWEKHLQPEYLHEMRVLYYFFFHSLFLNHLMSVMEIERHKVGRLGENTAP